MDTPHYKKAAILVLVIVISAIIAWEAYWRRTGLTVDYNNDEGPFLPFEERNFPRAKYWDHALKVTGVEGVNFMDYPAQSHFICPEWSHLSPAGAATYTKHLALILQQEKGWTFPKIVSP